MEQQVIQSKTFVSETIPTQCNCEGEKIAAEVIVEHAVNVANKWIQEHPNYVIVNGEQIDRNTVVIYYIEPQEETNNA